LYFGNTLTASDGSTRTNLPGSDRDLDFRKTITDEVEYFGSITF